jgi:hypothetical protein
MTHDTADTFGVKNVDRSGDLLQRTVNEGMGAAADTLHELEDKLRKLIERRPYTLALSAMALGFAYALIRRR